METIAKKTPNAVGMTDKEMNRASGTHGLGVATTPRDKSRGYKIGRASGTSIASSV